MAESSQIDFDTHEAAKLPGMAQGRHAIVFVVCLSAICAIVIGAGLWKSRTPPEAFDYANLPDDKRVASLSAAPILAFLKLDHMARGKTYRIGSFGMVHSALFNSAAFGEKIGGDFFNYYTHYGTLPDLVNIMAHVALSKRMPHDLAIVQIPNPRISRGAYLLDESPELGHPAMFPPRDMTGESLSRRMLRLMRMLIYQLKIRLDILRAPKSILGPTRGYVVFEPSECGNSAAEPAWIAGLPRFLAEMIALGRSRAPSDFVAWICNHKSRFGQSRDGSAAGLDGMKLAAPRPYPQTGRLGDREINMVAANMRRIDRIVADAGGRAVFWVAPVAALDHDVALNHAIDRVLKRLPRLRIIDARYVTTSLKYFIGDDKHPNERFFRWLVGRIREMGWLR